MRLIIVLFCLWNVLANVAYADIDAFERALAGDLSALDSCCAPSEEEEPGGWTLLVRGLALNSAGQTEAAIDAWEAAVREGEPMAVRMLAMHYLDHQDWTEAFAWSQFAMDVDAVEGDLNRNQLGGTWSLHSAIQAAQGLEPSQHERAEKLASSRIETFGPDFLTARNRDDHAPASDLEPTRRNAPRYPRALFEQGTPGWAYVVLEINDAGRVDRALTLAATDPAFGRAAERAIGKWRFAVGEIDEFPVLSRQRIDFNLR